MYKKQNRGSFLLLELMISLALVSLSTFNCVCNPMALLRTAKSSLALNELQRIVDQDYAQTRQLLYENKIRPEIYGISKKNSSRYYETAQVTCPLSKNKYQRKTYLWTHLMKKGPRGEEYRILAAEYVYVPINEQVCSKKQILFRYHIPLIITHFPETS